MKLNKTAPRAEKIGFLLGAFDASSLIKREGRVIYFDNKSVYDYFTGDILFTFDEITDVIYRGNLISVKAMVYREEKYFNFYLYKALNVEEIP